MRSLTPCVVHLLLCRYMYSMCLNRVYEIWLFGAEHAIDADGNMEPYNGRNRRLQLPLEDTMTMYDHDAGLHPYHQHVNHFQVTAVVIAGAFCPVVDLARSLHDIVLAQIVGVREPIDVDFIRVGEWRDTAPQLPNGTIIRFKPHVFTGTVRHPVCDLACQSCAFPPGGLPLWCWLVGFLLSCTMGRHSASLSAL